MHKVYYLKHPDRDRDWESLSERDKTLIDLQCFGYKPESMDLTFDDETLSDLYQLVAIEREPVSLRETARVYQGEVWSPNGEARDLIRALGLWHTSFSTGDMIEDTISGTYHIAGMRGFACIHKATGRYLPQHSD